MQIYIFINSLLSKILRLLSLTTILFQLLQLIGPPVLQDKNKQIKGISTLFDAH